MNRLLAVVFLTIISSSIVAETHKNSAIVDIKTTEVDLLIQWQSSQPFIKRWIKSKQQLKTAPFDVLIKSHTKKTDVGLELLSLPPLAIERSVKNRSLISFSLQAYFSQRVEAANNALGQLQQPIAKSEQDIVNLLTALVAISQGEFNSAQALLVAVPSSSELYLTAQYNLALVLVEQAQYPQAIKLLAALTPLMAQEKSLLRFVKLLHIRALGLSGKVDVAKIEINSLTNKDTYNTRLQIEIETLLANNLTKQALVPLIKLNQATKQRKLSSSQMEQLEVFETLGQHQEAQLSREKYQKQLLAYHKRQSKLVQGITERTNIDKLLTRFSDVASNQSVAHFSEQTQLIIAQVEKNNTLSHQLTKNLDSTKQYNDVLKKGLLYIAERFEPYSKSIYRSNAKNYSQDQLANDGYSELEKLLNELVGAPEPHSLRYKMLDGLSIWSTGKAFEQRWWFDPKADLKIAKLALDTLLSEPRNTYKSLLNQHIKALQMQMQQASQRAKDLIVELVLQKKQLAQQLKLSLAYEKNYVLADIESQLLWLGRGNLPSNAQEDLSTVSLKSTKRGLTFLTKSAQNPEIKTQASLLLANLHLEVSQQLNSTGQSKFRGITADIKRAIELYKMLYQQNDPALDQALIGYQLAQSYDLNGQLQQSLLILSDFTERFKQHPWRNEALFRAAELNFGFGDYDLAANNYQAVIKQQDSVFTERANYKLGWSYFKIGEYKTALSHFFTLVDTYWGSNQSGNHQQRLLDDVLRIIAMTFANLDGVASVEQFFSQQVNSDYQESIYLDLARYYQRKHRYSDAAASFESLARLFPLSASAPFYQSQIVKAYLDGGFPSKSWPAREQYVRSFGGVSEYWNKADLTVKNAIRHDLSGYLKQLAQRAHAKAQKSTLASDFNIAIGWYQDFIRDIKDAEQLPTMYFLMAQAYSQNNQHQLAGDAFEFAAYQFDDYDNKAQAGYRALLAYQQLYLDSTAENSAAILAQGVALTHRHLERFEIDANTPFVQTKLAEDYLIQQQYKQAIRWSNQLIDHDNDLDKALALRNWRVIAHANFELKQFDLAEPAYGQLIVQTLDKNESIEAKSRLAQSVYKQGEQARDAGELAIAINHFKRVAQVVPGDKIVVNAEFDAATAQMASERWGDAIVTLEQFIKDFPRHKLQLTIPEKLVIAFEKTENWPKAAQYLALIFKREGKSPLGRDALWRTAKLYQKAQQPEQAYQQFKTFIATFPRPLNDAIEARQQLVMISEQREHFVSQRSWLKEIIRTHDKAGSDATERSLYLASQSALIMGRVNKFELDKIKLKLPLKRSLARKQKAMKDTLYYLNKSITYGLAQHSTEATLLVGNIYRVLAKDLMSSPKPKQLNALELEQYEILLEEQAYPFEDKAIEFYELNVAQIGDDIYTQWIEQSLQILREIMPARYNKDEQVEVYHEAIQ